MTAAISGVDAIATHLAEQAANVSANRVATPSNVEFWDAGVVQQDGQLFQSVLDGAAIGEPNKVTPSESVVNSIQKVRDQFIKIQNHIESLASKRQDFSATDLFQLQYDVMQLSYINEISSKTADKTSQGAQTLFRNQG